MRNVWTFCVWLIISVVTLSRALAYFIGKLLRFHFQRLSTCEDACVRQAAHQESGANFSHVKKKTKHRVTLLLVSTVFGVVGGLANWHLRRDCAEGNWVWSAWYNGAMHHGPSAATLHLSPLWIISVAGNTRMTLCGQRQSQTSTIWDRILSSKTLCWPSQNQGLHRQRPLRRLPKA